MENVWSVTEAARKMGISPTHCRRLLETGQLSGRKLGHDWVVLSLDYQRKRAPRGQGKRSKEAMRKEGKK